MKIEMATKPADGTVKDQPFATGVGGSELFRIPAMVTLKDGTLVAAADARWNHTGDACALDTMVSRSADNGVTWEYTFANYLGDYGNFMSDYATAFIDPELATDGETVYMLVDLFPGGYGLNTAPLVPEKGCAFTEEGCLKLKANGEESYDYYVKNGRIFRTDGTEVSEYTVDGHFNLIAADGQEAGNVFYNAEAPEDRPAYQVYPTMYLYLTKSTDKGATWSEPSLLNVKKENEYFYGAGPGRGVVTPSGRLLFSCYNHEKGAEYTSVIYSDDQGVTWKRSADMAENCSESALMEADGVLYLFVRQRYETQRGYYISKDNGETWSERYEINDIVYDHSCQLTAIKYSRKIDGKTAVLFAAPGGYRRKEGRIFVGLLQDDCTIEWKYTYDINDGEYAYSCLTELADSRIGLLYELGDGYIEYRSYTMQELAPGAVIG